MYNLERIIVYIRLIDYVYITVTNETISICLKFIIPLTSSTVDLQYLITSSTVGLHSLITSSTVDVQYLITSSTVDL